VSPRQSLKMPGVRCRPWPGKKVRIKIQTIFKRARYINRRSLVVKSIGMPRLPRCREPVPTRRTACRELHCFLAVLAPTRRTASWLLCPCQGPRRGERTPHGAERLPCPAQCGNESGSVAKTDVRGGLALIHLETPPRALNGKRRALRGRRVLSAGSTSRSLYVLRRICASTSTWL